jgi:hypothetical protein
MSKTRSYIVRISLNPVTLVVTGRTKKEAWGRARKKLSRRKLVSLVDRENTYIDRAITI